MNYDNDYLKIMDDRQVLNATFSRYYNNLYHETNKVERFRNKYLRVRDCCSYWLWDKYEKNKILDLKMLNRCDDKFCPNCRDLKVAYAIHNFTPSFKEMINRDYLPFLMTLTIPNVEGTKLKSTVDKMMLSFRKFWEWYHKPVAKGYKGFKNRLVEFKACIKCLEINVQKTDFNFYHPHFHCLVFIHKDDYDPSLFHKYIDGAFQRRSNSYLKYSDMDIQIMNLWKSAFNGVRLTQKNIDNFSSDWKDLFQCDIREFDYSNPKSIFEIFKYTFKDKDIYSYKNFKDLFTALDYRRTRQGHGELFNINLEKEDGEKIELEEFLTEQETPQEIITREITDLYTVYQDYKKISRYKAHAELNNVAENLEG